MIFTPPSDLVDLWETDKRQVVRAYEQAQHVRERAGDLGDQVLEEQLHLTGVADAYRSRDTVEGRVLWDAWQEGASSRDLRRRLRSRRLRARRKAAGVQHG
ncbi:hypothetical protein CLV56_2071 [Mumia flava]|uniref:Uncharacterized protein n=1 Tax=Mumia flava TaxID=1348852 RepID=A0A2M9BIS1_9ACTN|nr:hypothetical protein [Mumia flava]PJJ57833.1 hypothetical protein CLV56_2071 [Mumia flava]